MNQTWDEYSAQCYVEQFAPLPPFSTTQSMELCKSPGCRSLVTPEAYNSGRRLCTNCYTGADKSYPEDFPSGYYYIPRTFTHRVMHKTGDYMFNSYLIDAWVREKWTVGTSMSDHFMTYICGGEL